MESSRTLPVSTWVSALLTGWTSPRSNTISTRRVHRKQQRQPLLFVKSLRAQHRTLLRWGRGAVPILLLVDAYL